MLEMDNASILALVGEMQASIDRMVWSAPTEADLQDQIERDIQVFIRDLAFSDGPWLREYSDRTNGNDKAFSAAERLAVLSDIYSRKREAGQ